MNVTEPAAKCRSRVTIGSLLLVVAALGVMLALSREFEHAYARIPKTAAAEYDQADAVPAVLAWIVITAVTSAAWRGSSLARVAARVLITAALTWTRYQYPGFDQYRIYWPLVCFGFGVTVPTLLLRMRPAGSAWARADETLLALIDSAAGALLVTLFADFVPTV